MARRKKIAIVNYERIYITLPEDLAESLNTFLDNSPLTDKTKTVRQAITEYLARKVPVENLQRIL